MKDSHEVDVGESNQKTESKLKAYCQPSGSEAVPITNHNCCSFQPSLTIFDTASRLLANLDPSSVDQLWGRGWDKPWAITYTRSICNQWSIKSGYTHLPASVGSRCPGEEFPQPYACQRWYSYTVSYSMLFESERGSFRILRFAWTEISTANYRHRMQSSFCTRREAATAVVPGLGACRGGQ